MIIGTRVRYYLELLELHITSLLSVIMHLPRSSWRTLRLVECVLNVDAGQVAGTTLVAGQDAIVAIPGVRPLFVFSGAQLNFH